MEAALSSKTLSPVGLQGATQSTHTAGSSHFHPSHSSLVTRFPSGWLHFWSFLLNSITLIYFEIYPLPRQPLPPSSPSRGSVPSLISQASLLYSPFWSLSSLLSLFLAATLSCFQRPEAGPSRCISSLSASLRLTFAAVAPPFLSLPVPGCVPLSKESDLITWPQVIWAWVAVHP